MFPATRKEFLTLHRVWKTQRDTHSTFWSVGIHSHDEVFSIQCQPCHMHMIMRFSNTHSNFNFLSQFCIPSDSCTKTTAFFAWNEALRQCLLKGIKQIILFRAKRGCNIHPSDSYTDVQEARLKLMAVQSAQWPKNVTHSTSPPTRALKGHWIEIKPGH